MLPAPPTLPSHHGAFGLPWWPFPRDSEPRGTALLPRGPGRRGSALGTVKGLVAVTEQEIAAGCGGGFGPSLVNEPCHGIVFFFFSF